MVMLVLLVIGPTSFVPSHLSLLLHHLTKLAIIGVHRQQHQRCQHPISTTIILTTLTLTGYFTVR